MTADLPTSQPMRWNLDHQAKSEMRSIIVVFVVSICLDKYLGKGPTETQLQWFLKPGQLEDGWKNLLW